jgi:hypothetical protein
MEGIATSDDPFDRWFRDYVRDVHGVSLEEPTPPPEQVLDYRLPERPRRRQADSVALVTAQATISFPQRRIESSAS